ncbi:Gfo/Idh/MocA family protein [Arvimicrobium flavum]|uniref:Gfo/Idh/MocA family protein n=1 Tax=Arvimicrobium flavum TaxID=3393320 RepID=UPI00237AB8FB|nr:Gfo/Idh/MocA family oxidoreductase [Mesorhizobium shangrilense]
MTRLGFIGAGPIAAQHATAFAAIDGVRLGVCASRSLENAERFRAEHGFAEARTIADFLAKPDVDAIVVVVPAIHMAEVSLLAARTGLPLLMEKPVGMSLEETRNAAALITQPNMVALNRRHYEVIAEGKRLLDEAGGARFVEVHMPEDIKALAGRYGEETLKAWHFGNSVHLIDLFRFFAGEANSVQTNNSVANWWDRSYSGLVDFASGARGLYNAQWYAPGPWRVTAYADNLCIVYAPIEEALVIRSPGRQRSEIRASGPDTRFKPGFFGQALAFVETVRTGMVPAGSADLADYLKSVELIDRLTAG